MSHLYKVVKKDIPKTGRLFAAAFQDDPVWKALFEKWPPRRADVFFESAARYCLRYGSSLSTSENLEGCIGWAPSEEADMTMRRAIACGSLRPMMLNMKLMMNMLPIFAPLEESRHSCMGSEAYLYLMILGVAPEHQGKGHGSRLLQAVLDEGDRAGIPQFLETSTEKNIRMYEKHGFTVTHEVLHPVIDLPQWGMVRNPSS